MNKLLFILLISGLFFASCNNAKTGDLNIVFQANYGDEVLEFGKTYNQLDGTAFTITRSDFFMSDVRMIKDDGTEEFLSDLEQIDFDSSPGGIKVSFEDVDATNYESIKFSIGLLPDVNATQPSDYDAASPLANAGYYWSAWDSYIFTKTEGRVDDGTGSITTGWIFHTGKDELLTDVTINVDRSVKGDELNEFRIVMDHKGLFEENGEAVELGINHDPSSIGILASFIDRMADSFTAVSN